MANVDTATHRELLLGLEQLVKEAGVTDPDGTDGEPVGKWSEVEQMVESGRLVGVASAAESMKTLCAEIDEEYFTSQDDSQRYKSLRLVVGVSPESIKQDAEWGELWEAQSAIDGSARYLHAPAGPSDPTFKDGKPRPDDLRWVEVPPTPEELDQRGETGLSLEEAARADRAGRLEDGPPNWWYKLDKDGRTVFAHAATVVEFSDAEWTDRDPRSTAQAAGQTLDEKDQEASRLDEAARQVSAGRLPHAPGMNWWHKRDKNNVPVFAQVHSADGFENAKWTPIDPRLDPQQQAEQYLDMVVAAVKEDPTVAKESKESPDLRQQVAQIIVEDAKAQR